MTFHDGAREGAQPLLPTCASPTTCPGGTDALTLTRGAAHGLVTALTQGGVTEAWTYNTYGELASQQSSHGATPLVSLVYDSAGTPRDQLGRIAEKVETRNGVTKTHGYTYDTQSRLTEVTLDGVVVEEFTYDDNGNRLTGYQQGEGTKAGVYDAQDRLISYGDLVYTYTENGELETKLDTVTGDEWSYEYDVFGNLLSVALPDGRLVAYITDGRHRRVGKMIDGVMVRQWLFEDQLNPVAELDGDGNLLWQYVYASRAHSPDFVVNAAGDVYRVISDQLGSPRLIVNVADDTDILLEATYSAFGERSVLAGDGSALSVGFAGGEFDVDSGLTRFGARDYDARVGRWTAKDPIGFDGGVNLYGYVLADPISSIDPEGKLPNPACALTLSFCAGFTVGNQLAKLVDGLVTCNDRVDQAKQDMDACSPEQSRREGAERFDAYYECLREFMGFNPGDVVEGACALAVARTCL